MKGLALASSLLFVAGAANADPAVITKPTDLLSQAAADAAKIETLNENTKVEVSESSGKWRKVKTSTSKAGWVSMFSLRPEGTPTSAPSSKANPLSIFGRASANASDGTTSRSLDPMKPEDLEKASPDVAEFQKMQKQAVSKDAAKNFAQRSKLAASSVEYLKDTSSSNSGSGAAPQLPMGM